MSLDKLKLPLLLLPALLSAAAGAGGATAVLKAEVAQAAAVAGEAKVKAEKLEEKSQGQAEQLAKITTELRYVNLALERIERAVTGGR